MTKKTLKQAFLTIDYLMVYIFLFILNRSKKVLPFQYKRFWGTNVFVQICSRSNFLVIHRLRRRTIQEMILDSNIYAVANGRNCLKYEQKPAFHTYKNATYTIVIYWENCTQLCLQMFNSRHNNNINNEHTRI